MVIMLLNLPLYSDRAEKVINLKHSWIEKLVQIYFCCYYGGAWGIKLAAKSIPKEIKRKFLFVSKFHEIS